MRRSLSVIVITKNEEKNILRCLGSVDWAEEVLIVDAGSTDRTQELARQAGARILEHPWAGYGPQKALALTGAKNEWILSIDADELVTPGLKTEILATLEQDEVFDGYEIPRRSYFLGHWMRHGGWYPGYQLRLFRKKSSHVNMRPVHEGFEVRGTVGRLTSPLDHFTYDSIAQYLAKMNDYTSLEVLNRLESRPGRRIRWYHLLLSPLSHFLRMFISLAGWRDGMHGFLLAVYSSLYTMLSYGKTWEYRTSPSRGMDLPPVTADAIGRWKEPS